jgi:HAE1 family hydrophobic/amphiphilic exporter-1
VVNFAFIPGLYVLMQKLRGEAKRTVMDDGNVVAPRAPSH